ncbi:hypothetical protein T4D_10992 [Trichinella pseudospiralis]|uniref:Uncharacterized protein n=1 Tax=Trichinella pseudospiralis TaxID=6337 RepID=A0A0V1FV36_TRIPS|nr:hypothetical protein T4D_10992 [Trichinella pseudospiralis]
MFNIKKKLLRTSTRAHSFYLQASAKQCSVANCRQNAMNGFIVLSIVRVVYFRLHYQQRRQAAFALCFALEGLGRPAVFNNCCIARLCCLQH